MFKFNEQIQNYNPITDHSHGLLGEILIPSTNHTFDNTYDDCKKVLVKSYLHEYG